MCVFLVKVVNQSIYTICKMLISYVRLDHTLYSINYGTLLTCIKHIMSLTEICMSLACYMPVISATCAVHATLILMWI